MLISFEQLHYTTGISTVNRRVLMFTKETISVHKICNILRGEDKNDSDKTLPLSFFSLFYYRKRRPSG